MSMNLNLSAAINATLENGKPKKIIEYFDLWQTPTKVSELCMQSKNIKQAYIDWVMERSEDEKVPIYDSEDVFEEYAPIGYSIVNEAKDHVKKLEKWLADHSDWHIKWFVM